MTTLLSKAAILFSPRVFVGCLGVTPLHCHQYLWRQQTRVLKAKFHYTSWFGASSELASVMEFGFRLPCYVDMLTIEMSSDVQLQTAAVTQLTLTRYVQFH